MSQAAAILEALHIRLATLATHPDLAAWPLTGILAYEPTSVEPPMIYSLLESVTRSPGSISTRRYRFLHRLVVRWVDNATAEATLLAYTPAIAAAIEADPHLGGVVASGGAAVLDQQAGFVVINKTLYRVLDSFSETVIKGRFQDGS